MACTSGGASLLPLDVELGLRVPATYMTAGTFGQGGGWSLQMPLLLLGDGSHDQEREVRADRQT